MEKLRRLEDMEGYEPVGAPVVVTIHRPEEKDSKSLSQ